MIKNVGKCVRGEQALGHWKTLVENGRVFEFMKIVEKKTSSFTYFFDEARPKVRTKGAREGQNVSKKRWKHEIAENRRSDIGEFHVIRSNYF